MANHIPTGSGATPAAIVELLKINEFLGSR